MSTRTQLKAFFETGDVPTQAQFGDLIDSLAHTTDDSVATQSWVAAGYQPLSAVLTATTASFLTSDETKLDGIATGATANSSDATLLARANHTGSQLASTISDFSAAVAATASVTANTAKVTNATHTGDATGSTALIVVAINGVNLAGLATGILKNTTGTGAPSIAVAGDFPTLNQNTTGSAATLTTPRNINGVAFDGSANITVTAAGSTLSDTVPVSKGGTGLTAVGSALQVLRTNAGATALEFATLSGGGNAQTADPLSQFAATTSAQLAGVISDETGSGALVFANSPVLVTPALGTPASGVLTNCTGTASGLTAGNVTTNANLTGHITSTGNAAVLGSFTSAQLATALTDETGSGANVFATSPVLVTPTLGVASATSINKVALTAPATGSTITIVDGKTFTCSNTLTLAGTDGSTLNIGAGGTLGSKALQSIRYYKAALSGYNTALSTGTKKGYFDIDVAGTVVSFKVTCDPGDEPSAVAAQFDLNSVNLTTGALTSILTSVASIATGANVSTGGAISGSPSVAVGDRLAIDCDQGSDGKNYVGTVGISES